MMLEFILCTSTNLFRIYLIHNFIHIFVKENKHNFVKEIFAYGSFFVINTCLYMLFHTAWLNLLCNLIGITLLVFLYTKSLKTILFVSSSICAINAACDVFSVLVFSSYEEGRGINQFCSVIMVFLVLICELVTEKIINYRDNSSEVQNLPLMLVPLCSIFMILFIFYTKNVTDMVNIIVNIGLLVINFLVFYLYNLLHKSFVNKYENEVLKQKVSLYSNQIDVIMQSEEKVKTMRHDMKHHINELKILANRNEITSIKEYLNSLEEYMQNPKEFVSSENFEIDSILNYMLQKAKEKSINVHSKIQLPEGISHSFDLVIILGNLLDNAIEAAEKSKNKIINVTILLQKNILKIKIENSFQDNNLDNIHFSSTKKDKKEQHGIGLNSVRKIVEKYNGIMNIETSDHTFCVCLFLYMDK